MDDMMYTGSSPWSLKIIAIGVGVILSLAALIMGAGKVGEAIDSQMPESAPRNFIHGLATRNCTQMLDHVCGTFVCPTLPNIAFEIRDQSFTVQSNDGKNATILTYVDIRAKGKLGEVKVELRVPLEVTKPGSRWCIQKTANLEQFLRSFIDSLR